MRVWIDVYDASDNRLGEGPVRSVQAVAVTRKLDGAGDYRLTVRGTDPRALLLLLNERRVVINMELADTVREVGSGVIKKRAISESGDTLALRGPDRMIALTNTNTLVGRSYSDEPIASVISDLIGLVPGWSATVDAGLGNYTGRFDGETVLKALQTIAKQQGVHFRRSGLASIEFGALGDDSGLWIVGKGRIGQELYQNDDIALIDKLDLDSSSEAVANWIIPLGGKISGSALTLEHSTRTAPYTIQTMTGPDGGTIYYLSDASSIATYGTIQIVKSWTSIKPLSSDPADVILASNMLYDAAVAWITRYSVQQDVYKVAVQKAWARAILPGQKVHIRYRGFVYRDGLIVDYLDVDTDFWVLEVTESLGATQSVALKLAAVDREEPSAAKAIVDTMDDVRELTK